MPGRLQLLGVLLGTRGASAVPAAGCLSELRVSSLWGLQAGERPESGFGVDIYVPPSGCCTVWGGVTGVRFGISALSPRRHRFRPPCRPWQSPAHGVSVATMPSLCGVEFATRHRPRRRGLSWQV